MDLEIVKLTKNKILSFFFLKITKKKKNKDKLEIIFFFYVSSVFVSISVWVVEMLFFKDFKSLDVIPN